MKKIMLITAAVLALACCNRLEKADPLVDWSFSAAHTKATLGADGAFSWSAGDQIKIWNATASSFVTFTDEVGKGVYRAVAPASASFSTALYPASVAASTSSVTLPAAYTSLSAAQKGFPMIATVDAENNTLAFSHLGALLRFRLNGVTADMTKLTVVSSDGSISGTFTIVNGKISLLSGSAGVAVSLSLSEPSNLGVTLPMPTGNYKYTIKVGTELDPAVYQATTGEDSQSFEKSKIYDLGSLTFFRGNVLLETGVEGEDFVVTGDNPSEWN